MEIEDIAILSNKTKLSNEKIEYRRKKTHLKRLYLQGVVLIEIFLIVVSLIIMLSHFALGISANRSSDTLQSLHTYEHIKDNLINIQVISDIQITNKEKNCSQDYYPYTLRTIIGINNTCKTISAETTQLRFEKYCTDALVFPSYYKIQEIYSTKFCHKIVPSKRYVYYFANITGSCGDKDFTCGSTDRALICLKNQTDITGCPIIDIKESSVVKNDSRYFSIGKIPEANVEIRAINITAGNLRYLAFKLRLQTFNDLTFYEYCNWVEMYYSNLNTSVEFELYRKNVDQENDYLDMNLYYAGKSTNYIDEVMRISFRDFAKAFNITGNETITPLYETIDPGQNASIRTSYTELMNDDCVDYFFLQNPVNNDRGLFTMMHDLSFDFLVGSLNQYITWNFIQCCTYFYFAFRYRIFVVMNRISNKYQEMDKKYETITVITFKAFHYCALAAKLMILFNNSNFLRDKINLVNTMLSKKCFIKTNATDLEIKNSFTHLNLASFSNEYSLRDLTEKFSLAYIFILIEIVLEFLFVLNYVQQNLIKEKFFYFIGYGKMRICKVFAKWTNDINPLVAWSRIPFHTKSFAIVIKEWTLEKTDDTKYYWIVKNIPSTCKKVEGVSDVWVEVVRWDKIFNHKSPPRSGKVEVILYSLDIEYLMCENRFDFFDEIGSHMLKRDSVDINIINE